MARGGIDFSYLEGRDGEFVVKELPVADCHSNRVASYVFKKPYTWDEVPAFNARLNNAIDHGCNWNDCDILYSVWKLLYIAKYHQLLQSIVSGIKSSFIGNLIERTFIDITQLGCPQPADLAFHTISCTFRVTASLNRFVP
jgi:hypothetical protein